MLCARANKQASLCAWRLVLQAFAGILAVAAWSPRPHVYEVAGSDGANHKSLYAKDGPVEVLVGQEDSKMLTKDANTIWIVEYYDTSCPHCWYFSAVYPALAKAIQSPHVRVGAFNCVDGANMKACEDAKVVSYPTVMIYNAKALGDSHVVSVHDETLGDPKPVKEISAWLQSYSGGKIQVLHPEVLALSANFKGSSHPVDPKGPPGKPGWTREALGTVATRFHDAHVGMARLLTDGYVNKEKYQAALNVVQFVSRAFRKDEKAIFDDLMAKLTARRDLEPAEFKSIMDDWVVQFSPDLVFCETKTCAVWQFFHGTAALMAIGYAPLMVAEALPKYRYMVAEFMDCEACRQHFMAAYDNCQYGRCSVLAAPTQLGQAKALVLWLWRVHNAVSTRVIAEHPAQGDALDRRWPTYKDCPACWMPSAVAGTPGEVLTFAGQTSNDDPLYGVFNEENVVNFIISAYLGTEIQEAFSVDAAHPWTYSPQTGFVAISCTLVGLTVLFLAIRFRSKRPCQLEEGTLGRMYDEMDLLPSAELTG